MEVTNRFKGLDLVDRVPEELWMYHCTGGSDQDHPQEKEMQKKQNDSLRRPYKELRREVKGKGEKERYSHLNAEFQRIARRDKKAFLSDQCKEIEVNNIMGKTKDLKKIRDTKGTFHAKMSTIKDRNVMDLTKAEILRRGGKNTHNNYTKKIFMTQITMMV